MLAYFPGKKYENAVYETENTIFPYGLELVPRKFAITYRNRWMIEQADYLISYVRSSYGGAHAALKFAKGKMKNIVNLADFTQFE